MSTAQLFALPVSLPNNPTNKPSYSYVCLNAGAVASGACTCA